MLFYLQLQNEQKPVTINNQKIIFLFFCFLDVLFSQRRVDAPVGLSYEPNRLSCDDWKFCDVFCFAENYFNILICYVPRQ